MRRQGRYKWYVAGYYAKDVKPPKKPGALAVEVGWHTDWGKDMEVRAFESRSDIGRVVVHGPYVDGEAATCAVEVEWVGHIPGPGEIRQTVQHILWAAPRSTAEDR